MQGTTDRIMYPICEAMDRLGISRSVIYEQIRAGRLRTVKVGRRRYVPAHSLEDYLFLLEREAEDGGAA